MHHPYSRAAREEQGPTPQTQPQAQPQPQASAHQSLLTQSFSNRPPRSERVYASNSITPTSTTPLATQLSSVDVEKLQLEAQDAPAEYGDYIERYAVNTFAWHSLDVSVKNTNLIKGNAGVVRAGELLAIMGPSGSGKTTLLHALARRAQGAHVTVEGQVAVDGVLMPSDMLRRISAFVEQEDALIGSLKVRETISFAAQLSKTGQLNKRDLNRQVDDVLSAMGLRNQANQLVGTPLQKGISGGQKRRVSVAAQLITGPSILFLDEPTSGLDSKAAHQVVTHLRKVAKRYNIIVIASIHQPSLKTFNLFDKVMLLSGGKTCYWGGPSNLEVYLRETGFAMLSRHENPAEFAIDMLNVDFIDDEGDINREAETRAMARLESLKTNWLNSSDVHRLRQQIESVVPDKSRMNSTPPPRAAGFLPSLMVLLHRNFIKSRRDVVAYGVRLAMYIGLAIMMGTVWVRLQPNQDSIQPFINALFFGSAFMSFMAVAYVPAYLEDRKAFIRERNNGLYGATPFILANFITGLLPLFLISLIFSIVTYWLVNFRDSGSAFGYYIMWLFLDLLAAESLVVLVGSLFPNFVLSLAIVAFANGLWMSVGGFLVAPTVLNVFYRYPFHYADYQTYVFQGMMVNEFSLRNYTCASTPSGNGPNGNGRCACMYQSQYADECLIAGQAVLDTYGYTESVVDKTGQWVGIMVCIIVIYRLLGWLVVWMKRT